jgi:hypothetical protein
MSDLESRAESLRNPSAMGDPEGRRQWGRGISAAKLASTRAPSKEERERRKEKNEANTRLTTFKKSFSRPAGAEVPTLQEKI